MKKISFLLIFLLIGLIGVSTYAYFNNFYVVTFISDGKAVKEKISKTTTELNEKAPLKSGYTFLYWLDDNTIVDKDYKISNNAILVAVYKKITPKKYYTVTFNTDGGNSIESLQVEEEEKINEPTIPTKDGYVFKEWLLDGISYDFNLPVNKNIELKASYIKATAKTYTVSFNTDGGSYIANRVVEQNGIVSRPASPLKPGYLFREWTLNGLPYNFGSKVTSNITLKATYKLDVAKTYTITFDTKGGSSIKNQTVREGSKIAIPANPTKTGYTFADWIYKNQVYDFNTKVTSNMVLEAIYTKNPSADSNVNSYAIAFDTDGGTKVSVQLVTEGKSIIKPADPVKSGYTFKEWTYNGKTYDFNAKVTKAMTLKAVYTKNEVNVPTYTIIFDTDGGSEIENQIVKANEKATKPTNPIKEGYTFKEWTLNGSTYYFNESVMNDMTLKATYEKNEDVMYTVTFDTDGGSNIESQTIKENEKVTKPTSPTKEGYTFVRWELDGTEYNFNTSVTGDITLKAVYQAKPVSNTIKTYIVTFDTDGGSNIGSQTVKENEKVTKPTNPTKEGHTFVRWELDGSEYDFDSEVTSNITLNAIYEINDENL